MAASALSAGYLRGTAQTTLITASFAAFWGLYGSVAIPGPIRIVLITLVLLLTALFFGRAFAFARAARHRPATDARPTLSVPVSIVLPSLRKWSLSPSSVGCSPSPVILTPSYPRLPSSWGCTFWPDPRVSFSRGVLLWYVLPDLPEQIGV
jgi:hypothetical protein